MSIYGGATAKRACKCVNGLRLCRSSKMLIGCALELVLPCPRGRQALCGMGDMRNTPGGFMTPRGVGAMSCISVRNPGEADNANPP